MCILDNRKLYTFVHSADQKNRLHTNDFAYGSLHFKQERRNWSPTFFKPPPPPPPPLPPVHTFLHTRTQTN